MDRKGTTALNFAANFLVGYAVAALFKGRRTGVRVGLLAGALGAAVGWLGYERPELFESTDDDAEPIEIDV